MNRIADPQMFLLCFFFDVLLDQAIHHANREHHQVYDQTYKPTKFRGILATASTNMPPRHLIILAVLHGPPLQLSESDFRAFCSWILTHLKGRIEDWALNAGMPCAKARSSVLSAMHTEIALDVLGASAQGGRQDSYFSITYPVEEVCERLKIVRDAVYASLEHVGP